MPQSKDDGSNQLKKPPLKRTKTLPSSSTPFHHLNLRVSVDNGIIGSSSASVSASASASAAPLPLTNGDFSEEQWNYPSFLGTKPRIRRPSPNTNTNTKNLDFSKSLPPRPGLHAHAHAHAPDNNNLNLTKTSLVPPPPPTSSSSSFALTDIDMRRPQEYKRSPFFYLVCYFLPYCLSIYFLGSRELLEEIGKQDQTPTQSRQPQEDALEL